jgi:hypothetical protein
MPVQNHRRPPTSACMWSARLSLRTKSHTRAQATRTQQSTYLLFQLTSRRYGEIGRNVSGEVFEAPSDIAGTLSCRLGHVSRREFLSRVF